jgi:hypothetical protein
LIGKFKIAVDDVKYMFIPTGMKGELVRSGVGWDQKG